MHKLPVLYQAWYTYILPRHRSPNRIYVAAHTEIEIAEVPATDTDLVARLRFDSAKGESFYYDAGVPARMYSRPERELRYRDGQFWLEWGDVGAFAESIETGGGLRETPFDGLYTFDAKRALVDDVQNFKWKNGPFRVWTNTRRTLAEKIQHGAKNLITIDGKLFERVSEPMLVHRKSFNGQSAIRLAGLRPQFGYSRSGGDGPVPFRSDRLDQFERMAAGLQAAGFTVEGGSPADILRPDLLFACPVRTSAHDELHSLMAQFSHVAPLVPASLMGLFMDLRDAVARSPRAISTQVRAALREIASMPDPEPEYLRAAAESTAFKATASSYHNRVPTTKRIGEELETFVTNARAGASGILAAMDLDPGFVWDHEIDSDATDIYMPDRRNGTIVTEVTDRESLHVTSRRFDVPFDEMVAHRENGGRVLLRETQDHSPWVVDAATEMALLDHGSTKPVWRPVVRADALLRGDPRLHRDDNPAEEDDPIVQRGFAL